MENAGGKVKLESERGKGCEFNLFFRNPVLKKEKMESAYLNSKNSILNK